MVAPVPAFLASLPPDADAVAVRDGNRWIVGATPDAVVTGDAPSGMAALRDLPPGLWAGWLAYDLGRAIERVVPQADDDLPLPDLLLGRFDAHASIDDAGRVEIHGDGRGRPFLEAAARRLDSAEAPPPPALDGWRSGIEREEYEAAVRAVIELIRAGDCYQVNLTRRLVAPGAGDPVGLFAALAEVNPAPHGAFARLGDVAVVSASPEQFLRLRDGVVTTRPIKGTGRDPHALAASAKDRAENVMIVDLARNDLGRVCEYGSIATPGLCELERHPGLYHLTSTVRGVLRAGATAADLVAATFPAASITGAPKPRVMQIIEDVEPVRRGVYCGAVGWIDTRDERPALDLNVAIRTFTITEERTVLGVGGGIVADSDPGAEWEETELKAARLLDAAGAGVLVGA